MIDVDALCGPEPVPAPARGLPSAVLLAPTDADGNPIPVFWQQSPNWKKLAAVVRKKWSDIWVAEEIEKDRLKAQTEAAILKRGAKLPNTKFTTRACVAWVKRQRKPDGRAWHIIDVERWGHSYDPKKPTRTSDLLLGLDVLADNGYPGMVGLQAGQHGEEKDHVRKFLGAGGPAKAKDRYITVFWQEYTRGNPEPAYQAEWTESYLRNRFPDLFAAPKAFEL